MTPAHRNITKFNKILTVVEECNRNLYKAINDTSLDCEEAETILTSGLAEFNDLQEKLRDLPVVNKTTKIKSKLYETLDYNISVYNLTLNILRNPDDKDIINKYNEFSKTYELLLKNYEELNLLGLKSSFPKESKSFFDNYSGYVNTLIKINGENDIKTNQRNEYISNLKEFIDNFDEINESLEPALTKIHEDGRSLDTLLKDIKEKKSKFNKIKTNSYSLSIPEDGNECYEIFQDTLNYYDLYITSLEHSIIIESSNNNDEKNTEYINKNYSNSFSKYEDFKNSLNDLKAELNALNKK